jgi:hypothetical protein
MPPLMWCRALWIALLSFATQWKSEDDGWIQRCHFLACMRPTSRVATWQELAWFVWMHAWCAAAAVGVYSRMY